MSYLAVRLVLFPDGTVRDVSFNGDRDKDWDGKFLHALLEAIGLDGWDLSFVQNVQAYQFLIFKKPFQAS